MYKDGKRYENKIHLGDAVFASFMNLHLGTFVFITILCHDVAFLLLVKRAIIDY